MSAPGTARVSPSRYWYRSVFAAATRHCDLVLSAPPSSVQWGRSRPLSAEEGRQRVSDRNRLEPHRDRGRHHGALGHRRHHLPQAPRSALSPGGRVGPNAMVMINAAGKIEMVNAQAERLFGYDRSRAARQPIEMLVPDVFARATRGCAAHSSRIPFTSDGRGPRSVWTEEGRQRVPHRNRPEPDRNRRRHHGAVGHRRHHLRASAWRSASAKWSNPPRMRW